MALHERVCEVYASADGTRWTCGTGLLLDGHLILTAAHVVPADRPSIRIRVEGDKRYKTGEVVWHRYDLNADAAVIRITEPGFEAPSGLPPLRWGRLVSSRPGTGVDAMGFPGVRATPGVRDTDHLVGDVRPLGLARAGLLDVAVHSPPKRAKADDPSPWKGMSGAGLFCNNVLVGVVSIDDPKYDSSRVGATPLAAFVDDPAFARLVWPDGAPGLEPAELVRLQQQPPHLMTPASLLRADAAVVPFRGRDALLKRFTEWCDEPTRKSAWLLTGAGGQGKTRLARHFAGSMRRKGWATLVLRTGKRLELDLLAHVNTGLLLVIDYAERRADQFEALGQALADRDLTSTKPLRVLLIARSDKEWRQDLRKEGLGFAADSSARVTDLDPLNSDRRALTETFLDAVTAFAGRLDALSHARSMRWPDLIGSVHMPSFHPPVTALGVQMAALVALLQQGQPGEDVYRETTTVADLMGHESAYWEETANRRHLDFSIPTLHDLVAASCLLPIAGEAAASGVLARVPAMRDAGSELLRRTVGWLTSLYPMSPDGSWTGLQPDLLAEYHVARAVHTTTDLLPALLTGVDDHQAQQALTLLSRAAARDPKLAAIVQQTIVDKAGELAPAAIRVSVETPDPQPLLAALHEIMAGADTAPPALLRAMHDALPLSTEVHAELAVELAQRLVDLDRASAPPPATGFARLVNALRAPGPPPPSQPLARSLNELSWRLSQLKRDELAVDASREATELYRRLARADRDHLPGLAASLANLSNRLGQLNLNKEAFERGSEAVKIYESLSQEKHGADLAGALGALSLSLGALGRKAAELEAVEKTVAIRRRLAKANTGAAATPARVRARADYARWLSNYSNTLAATDRDNRAALEAITEAVAIYRELCEVQSDAYRPDLATTLTNLTIRQTTLGHLREALEPGREAVSIFTDLQANRADHTYVVELGKAHHAMAICWSELGDRPQAMVALRRAVALYRRSEGVRPGLHRGQLSRALATLASWLRDEGRIDEADMVNRERTGLGHFDE